MSQLDAMDANRADQTRRRRVALTAATAALCILGTKGCARGAESGAESSGVETTRSASSVLADTAAGFDTVGRADTSTQVSEVAILTRVEAARHDGYERIVFEFRGGAPRYDVRYRPTAGEACGSGDAVSVEGTAYLFMSFTPADAHVFDGERAESSIPERQLRPAFSVLRELKLTCDFEAEVAWSAGLSGRRGFSVRRLDSPTRLIIDISSR